ncbi:MAG: GFA family protein [Kordiimonadaceae bacterium]|nr:GFA family protein [Kordiimonadaceae bacterium]MBO6568667.1 GFA family protein [Kordiimonadaceae bacterium]MBO6965357.1 GFA family protein [Kordiimonadaceae bacterium]
MITGKCECGTVQYQITSPIHEYSHCHCEQCRRLSGAPFASFIGVSVDGFTFISGQDKLARYSSSEGHTRVFCRTCGANIMVEIAEYPDDYFVYLGTVDGEPDLPDNSFHMFVRSKAPWYEIRDGAPQYDTFPPDD